ncbi:unnamed protein product [Acanthoscelides obtectus]|uniref:Uncharacterized protein n=1 Tax=Acanthoscelides obtectus TaxID=200917 RepID=A0A9P0L9T3_ACAOB|nr:unnamed protein product [Acanthoscelides obtectus]CAK1684000.1 hypothetical protein AOBTE_LOCUS34577 [Acanthoscelides obtectus]
MRLLRYSALCALLLLVSAEDKKVEEGQKETADKAGQSTAAGGGDSQAAEGQHKQDKRGIEHGYGDFGGGNTNNNF